MRLTVIAPGFLTTVQDLGRPGYAHLGISASGAADALSLRAGNLVLGNHESAPALEMTLVGGSFQFHDDTWIALSGSDFGAGVELGVPHLIRAGETLRCGPTRGGARCYLCVRGGIDAPLVLGSASVHIMTGVGGRPLKKGDVLLVGSRSARPLPRPSGTPQNPSGPRNLLRIVPGPQSGWFDPGALCRGEWQVSEESNRMGLRLRGTALTRHEGRMLTEGVPLGAVQVPPEGQPIILFVEHQTTGGYPKIASVISADFHRVGQLRPRDPVRFETVTLERAFELLREQEDWLHSLA